MDVLNEILKIDGVKEVRGTYGVYDIFVKLQGSTKKDIDQIITTKIRKTKNVVSTTTLSVIPEQGGK